MLPTMEDEDSFVSMVKVSKGNLKEELFGSAAPVTPEAWLAVPGGRLCRRAFRAELLGEFPLRTGDRSHRGRAHGPASGSEAVEPPRRPTGPRRSLAGTWGCSCLDAFGLASLNLRCYADGPAHAEPSGAASRFRLGLAPPGRRPAALLPRRPYHQPLHCVERPGALRPTGKPGMPHLSFSTLDSFPLSPPPSWPCPHP
jgi:hypothetical protein